MSLIFLHFYRVFNPLAKLAPTPDYARRWARQAEILVDQGLSPDRSSIVRLPTFGELVDLHIADICLPGKPPRTARRQPTLAEIDMTPARPQVI
jgi:hypothetical protein